MKIIIRKVKTSDITEIQSINSASVPHVDFREKTYFENCINETQYYYVAECDGKVVGFILAFDQNHQYESENFIYFKNSLSEFIYNDRIAIDEKFHGYGIGSMLYNKLKAHSNNHVPIACEVNTNPPNIPSIKFHQSLGFKIKEEVTTSNGKTVAYMIR